MHIITILAFACLFWHAEGLGAWRFVRNDDVLWTLTATIAWPLVLGGAAAIVGRRVRNLLSARPDAPDSAHLFHHRAMGVLRILLLCGFGVAVLGTNWPSWFAYGRVTPALQLFGDLIVVSPFLLGALLQWMASFRVERAFHHSTEGGGRSLRLRSYLDFNIRHQFLVVAVPMTLILFAANLVRGYEAPLRRWSGWIWTPDVVLVVCACAVFITAPLLLCRIWRTEPLEAGPLRERLELICERIGLRCRDILIWKSDGLMINAAVMGIFAPVRYVLLSDALLSTMDVRQVEAVFGHEAGHVRHRHIQHFLVFALLGWIVAAASMEVLARTLGGAPGQPGLSLTAIQGIGAAVTLVFWGIGFGWVSRRFERQADVFGAQCVVADGVDDCGQPCSVHRSEDTTVAQAGIAQAGRVCATGAEVFASALKRVAVLNGIPVEERSWRHSSIGSRIRFLRSLAGDPARAERFDRLIRRIKMGMVAAAVVGSLASAYYWSTVSQPSLAKFQAGVF